MKSRVYIETSFVSYLTAAPSNDLIVGGHQQATREWWKTADQRFELFTSQVAMREASAGNPDLAERRLVILRTLKRLRVNKPARDIAAQLIAKRILPQNALDDALHIGVAVAHGIDYMVTWNFRHLANALMRRNVDAECESMGYRPAQICTCEQLKE